MHGFNAGWASIWGCHQQYDNQQPVSLEKDVQWLTEQNRTAERYQGYPALSSQVHSTSL
jgi:hypothetical protein